MNAPDKDPATRPDLPPLRADDVGREWFGALAQISRDQADIASKSLETVKQIKDLQRIGPALKTYVDEHILPAIEAAGRDAVDLNSPMVNALRAQLAQDMRLELVTVNGKLDRILEALNAR